MTQYSYLDLEGLACDLDQTDVVGARTARICASVMYAQEIEIAALKKEIERLRNVQS